MIDRKYLPTFAELVDRLSIAILKSIFISEHKEAYEKEQEFIMHDIDQIIIENSPADVTVNCIRDIKEGESLVNYKPRRQAVNARIIRAMLILMLTNRFIWENESKARAGGSEQDKLLKLTHSINGVRNTAKNQISAELGERVDLKIDCLAEELVKEFGNWNVF